MLESCVNFIKKWHRHRCFSVNIAKVLRTPFLKNIYEELLLNIGKSSRPECSEKEFRRIDRKTQLVESHFNEAWNFSKTWLQHRSFPEEFCEIFKNTNFVEDLRTAASVSVLEIKLVEISYRWNWDYQWLTERYFQMLLEWNFWNLFYDFIELMFRNLQNMEWFIETYSVRWSVFQK